MFRGSKVQRFRGLEGLSGVTFQVAVGFAGGDLKGRKQSLNA